MAEAAIPASGRSVVVRRDLKYPG